MEVTAKKHHWGKNKYLDTLWFFRHLTSSFQQICLWHQLFLINRKYSSHLWWVPYVDIVNTSPRRLHRKPRLKAAWCALCPLQPRCSRSSLRLLHVSQKQHKYALRHLSLPKTGVDFYNFTVCSIYYNSKAGAWLNTLRKFTLMHTKPTSKFRRNLSHYLLTSHTGSPGNHGQFKSIKYQIKWASCSTHSFPLPSKEMKRQAKGTVYGAEGRKWRKSVYMCFLEKC